MKVLKALMGGFAATVLLAGGALAAEHNVQILRNGIMYPPNIYIENGDTVNFINKSGGYSRIHGYRYGYWNWATPYISNGATHTRTFTTGVGRDLVIQGHDDYRGTLVFGTAPLTYDDTYAATE